MKNDLIFTSEDGNITLEVTEDKFSAFITIKETNCFINENDILSLIANSGIKVGFEKALEKMHQEGLEKKFNERFYIAYMPKSIDPQVEYDVIINRDNCFNEDEFSGNFSILSKFESVVKDQPLAHLFITKPGKSAVNIFEEEILPEITGEDLIKNYLGDGVYYSEERSQVFAKKSGYPYFEGDKIFVKSEFEINSDVDLKFDNFSMLGDLIINGNVTQKIEININGDLTINGDINDSSIIVDGNITVNGDILNCQQKGIHATGDVSFESAEHSKVISGNKITFLKNANFCKLIAEKGIFGDENDSRIVGGLAQSGENIESAIIGNSGAIGTEVEITISPYLKERMLNITKKLARLKEDQNNNVESIEQESDKLQQLENQLEESVNTTLMGDGQVPKHIVGFKRIFPGTYLEY